MQAHGKNSEDCVGEQAFPSHPSLSKIHTVYTTYTVSYRKCLC